MPPNKVFSKDARSSRGQFFDRVRCVRGGVHVRGFLPALYSVKGDLGMKSVLISIVTPR